METGVAIGGGARRGAGGGDWQGRRAGSALVRPDGPEGAAVVAQGGGGSGEGQGSGEARRWTDGEDCPICARQARASHRKRVAMVKHLPGPCLVDLLSSSESRASD